jgi:WD40 repeat protein
MSLLASVSNNLKFWDFKDDNLMLSSTAEFFTPDTREPRGGRGGGAIGTDASELLALSWNHNQQVIAVGGTGQKLHLVQANTGQTLSSLPIDEKDNFVGDIRALSFSHNSRYLASAIEHDVAVWDLKKRNIRVRLSGHKSIVKALQFTNEGSVVSGDTSGAMVIWNVDQSSRSKDLINPGYRSPMNCLRLSPSNHRHVCCGYGDGSVTVWDVQSQMALNRCPTAHSSAVTTVAYSPKNDRLVATGGKDGQLNLVDLGSKHDKFSPAVSLNVGEHISSLSFHDSALYTAVGTDSGYIYIYDWRNSRKPVVQFAAHNPMCVHELAFQVRATEAINYRLYFI